MIENLQIIIIISKSETNNHPFVDWGVLMKTDSFYVRIFVGTKVFEIVHGTYNVDIEITGLNFHWIFDFDLGVNMEAKQTQCKNQIDCTPTISQLPRTRVLHFIHIKLIN